MAHFDTETFSGFDLWYEFQGFENPDDVYQFIVRNALLNSMRDLIGEEDDEENIPYFRALEDAFTSTEKLKSYFETNHDGSNSVNGYAILDDNSVYYRILHCHYKVIEK